MTDIPGGVTIVFDDDVWEEEVERYDARSRPRVAAEAARKLLERADATRDRPFRRCAELGPDGTYLVRCLKIDVPLDVAGRADAPFAFVFQFSADRQTGTRLELRLLAFGERHPPPGARSVYERAHKRLHRRYPGQ